MGKSVAKSRVGKSVLNKAKKTGLKAGINVVGDTLKGKNVLKSAKARTKEAVGELSKGIAKSAAKALSSPGKRSQRRKKTDGKVVATPAALVKRGKGKKRGGGGGGGKRGGGGNENKTTAGGACSNKGAGVQKTIEKKRSKRRRRKKDLLDL